MTVSISNLMWIVTGAAICGTILNIQKSALGFVIWTGTNISFAVYNYHRKEYAQSALFIVYTVLSVWGIYEWIK